MSYLTKKQLIELMAELPDDTPVFIEYDGYDSLAHIRAQRLEEFTHKSPGNHWVDTCPDIDRDKICVSICGEMH